MITLYTFPPAFGLRNVSPFCLKVEMALAYLNLEFDIALQSNPQKSPKGKLPYIECDEGIIADSELIYEYLDRKTGGGIFGSLTPVEYATGFAMTRLTEDHLYWLMVASRWADDAWFPHVRQGFFGNLPPLAGNLVARLARRQVLQSLHLQGLGRHSLEEQAGFARRDFRALAGALSEQPYIAGDRLTCFDFAVASLLAGIYDNQPATWITNIAAEYPSLKAYAERIQEEVGVFSRK